MMAHCYQILTKVVILPLIHSLIGFVLNSFLSKAFFAALSVVAFLRHFYTVIGDWLAMGSDFLFSAGLSLHF